MNRLKILIVSKFLYARGGAETYAISLGEMLKMHNHEVRFFSMSYPENINVSFWCRSKAELRENLRRFSTGCHSS